MARYLPASGNLVAVGLDRAAVENRLGHPLRVLIYLGEGDGAALTRPFHHCPEGPAIALWILVRLGHRAGDRSAELAKLGFEAHRRKRPGIVEHPGPMAAEIEIRLAVH